MKAVTPIVPGANLPVTLIAKNQKEYKTLPAYIDRSDGMVLTHWKLTWRERLRVIIYGDIYHFQLTFNGPLQPLSMQVERPQIASPIVIDWPPPPVPPERVTPAQRVAVTNSGQAQDSSPAAG